MSDDVYLGLDLLAALVVKLRKEHYDYVCLSTNPGDIPDGAPALFIKAVNSSNPGAVVNFAAVETEDDAKLFFTLPS